MLSGLNFIFMLGYGIRVALTSAHSNNHLMMLINPLQSVREFRADTSLTIEAATLFVSDFYALLDREMTGHALTPAERQSMCDARLYYGRYLNPRTRPYFEETVIPVIANGLVWLNRERSNVVLDLGCGLGMQSILLAAMGKSVVAVDIRPECIALGEKRLRYYEQILGRKLDIEFVCANFNEDDLSRYVGRFDGVFSMSAFSYMRPLEDSVSRVSRLCSKDARVFLFEENSANVVSRILRRRSAAKPSAVIGQFEKHGFEQHSLQGTCSLPKQLWRYPAVNRYVRNVDAVLRRSMHLAFSYALKMARSKTTNSGRPDPGNVVIAEFVAFFYDFGAVLAI